MGLTKNLTLYISIILILILSPNFVESAGTHYCSEVDTSACTAISATSISSNTLSLSSISSLNKTNLFGAASPLLYVDNTAGLYAASFADDILTDNIILKNNLGRTIKVQDAAGGNGGALYIYGGKGIASPPIVLGVPGGNVFIAGGSGDGDEDGNVYLAHTGSAARGAVGIGTSSVSSGYSLDVNGNTRAADFCTSGNPSKCLSTMSAAPTFPIALPAAGGFDFTLANDGWTGINLANSEINKRIILGVDATRTGNIFDIEDVTNWKHRMELRADGSAAFTSAIISGSADVDETSAISGTKLDVRGPIATSSIQDGGALRIYDLADTTNWFEINFDKTNNWGTFQRTIVPTIDGINGGASLGDPSRRWISAYLSGTLITSAVQVTNSVQSSTANINTLAVSTVTGNMGKFDSIQGGTGGLTINATQFWIKAVNNDDNCKVEVNSQRTTAPSANSNIGLNITCYSPRQCGNNILEPAKPYNEVCDGSNSVYTLANSCSSYADASFIIKGPCSSDCRSQSVTCYCTGSCCENWVGASPLIMKDAGTCTAWNTFSYICSQDYTCSAT